jgi:transposase-like protein
MTDDVTREAAPIQGAFKIDEQQVRGHVDKLVRQSVEQTLNVLLEQEAKQLCGAGKYERTDSRKDTRAGSYKRKLHTKAGEVTLRVPRLRSLPFETQIIERYKRRESSVEESLIEMYLAGVSVRRVEDITEALWGTKVSPSTVSELNQKVYKQLDAWRNKPISGGHPYVYIDGTYLKRSWGGEVKNVAILVAIGVAEDGYREVLGIAEGAKEDKASWLGFLRHLKTRGLDGTRLFVSDACLGLVEAFAEVFPAAQWQRCVVHWYRNGWSHVPKGKVKEVAAMLKAIHASEDREAALKKAEDVATKLEGMKLKKAATWLRETVESTLAYMSYPREHWTRLRTNNPQERLMREIKRRTKVVGAFPDGNSALMLSAARLRHIAGTKWGTRRYMDMTRLYELENERRQQEGERNASVAV